jgi:hypothetical protein
LPIFPGISLKSWTDHTDKAFILQRKQQLQEYMEKLIAVPHALGNVHLLKLLQLI